MTPKLEKYFYSVVLILFLGSLIAFVQGSDKPYTFQWYFFFILMIGSLITAILMLFYNKIVIAKLWKRRLGVVHVYKNRSRCETLIKDEYKKARNCRIFILRGMSDFVTKDTSLFASLSSDDIDSVNRKLGSNGSVRILIASPKSKFFSEGRYKQIREKEGISKISSRTTEDIKTVVAHLDRLKERINLSYRFYTDALLCKFYLFDDVGFVTFNERNTKIDQYSPTLHIKRIKVREFDEKHSEIWKDVGLFTTLERYFDFLWDFQSRTTFDL